MEVSKLDEESLDRPRMPIPDPAIIPLIKAYDAMRSDATPALLHDVISLCRAQQTADVTLEQAAKLFSTCIDFQVEVDPRNGQHHIQRIILGKSDGG